MRTLRWRLMLWYGGMAAAILILLASALYLSARSSLIAIRQDDVRDTVLRRLLLTEAAAVARALALKVGLGPKLAGRALKPLRSVSTAAGEIRRGKLGSRLNLPELKSRRDEVGELASSFDAMAESLERLFEAERESKETLSRFVADASH